MNAVRDVRPSESGFVLVGVVMFVLALAILGLSLFSLSSYEAGFFQQSLDQERATQQAAGGVELVKSLVAMSPDDLSRAKAAEGQLGIVHANAWQVVGATLDSVGGVDWSKHVFIRVKTRVGQSVRLVEGRFIPKVSVNPYKHVITSRGPVWYNIITPPGPLTRMGSTTLTGKVWQSVGASIDTAWTSYVDRAAVPPIRTEPAPVANVGDYFAANMASATPTQWVTQVGAQYEMTLDAGSSTATRFFRSPAMAPSAAATADLGTSFDFFNDKPLNLNVRGKCVWMAPAGIRFDGRLNVRRIGGMSATNTLIIVAGPNGRLTMPQDYRDIGIWLFTGMQIESNDVRVFLVSDGELRLEDFAGDNQSDMMGVSLFGDGLWFMGPRQASGKTWNLRYEPDMDARVDDLLGAGLLPSATGIVSTSFTLVPGSWREQ